MVIERSCQFHTSSLTSNISGPDKILKNWLVDFVPLIWGLFLLIFSFNSSFKTMGGDRGHRQTFLPTRALLKNLNSPSLRLLCSGGIKLTKIKIFIGQKTVSHIWLHPNILHPFTNVCWICKISVLLQVTLRWSSGLIYSLPTKMSKMWFQTCCRFSSCAKIVPCICNTFSQGISMQELVLNNFMPFLKVQFLLGSFIPYQTWEK